MSFCKKLLYFYSQRGVILWYLSSTLESVVSEVCLKGESQVISGKY